MPGQMLCEPLPVTHFCRKLTTIMNRSPGESMFQPALRGQHQASAFTRSNRNRSAHAMAAC